MSEHMSVKEYYRLVKKPAAKKGTCSEEHEAQCAVIEWAEWNTSKYPELELLHHCPNGEKRDKAVAARLKRAGTKAGIPDLHLPVSRGAFTGLYIEMKAKGGRLSPAQAKMIRRLRDENNDVKVCYSASEAIAVIEVYLSGKKWNQQDLLNWIASKYHSNGG